VRSLELQWARLVKVAECQPIYRDRPGMFPLAWHALPPLLAERCDPSSLGLIRTLAQRAERGAEEGNRPGVLHLVELIRFRWVLPPARFPEQCLRPFLNAVNLPVWRCPRCRCNWAGSWGSCPLCHTATVRDCVEALWLVNANCDIENPGLPIAGAAMDHRMHDNPRGPNDKPVFAVARPRRVPWGKD
jgi:hypothetical protein